MTSYKELLSQISRLQQEAEEVRRAELERVITDIRAKMDEYGITVQDLSGSRKAKPVRVSQTVAPKYRDPATGATWSGRGKQPRWMVGRNKAEFLIR